MICELDFVYYGVLIKLIVHILDVIWLKRETNLITNLTTIALRAISVIILMALGCFVTGSNGML